MQCIKYSYRYYKYLNHYSEYIVEELITQSQFAKSKYSIYFIVEYPNMDGIHWIKFQYFSVYLSIYLCMSMSISMYIYIYI